MIIHTQYEQVDVFAHQSAKNGNEYCGDSYYIHETEDYFLCAVADGLGSGIEAQESSWAAISAIKQHREEDVHQLMQRGNDVLRNKRGAVMAVFKLYYDRQELEYSCVGNIRFVLYSPDGKITHPIPQSGYLSGKPAKVSTKTYRYEPGSTFLIHSDGLDIRSIKSVVWELHSIKAASQAIRSMVEKPKDDVTFLLGEIM